MTKYKVSLICRGVSDRNYSAAEYRITQYCGPEIKAKFGTKRVKVTYAAGGLSLTVTTADKKTYLEVCDMCHEAANEMAVDDICDATVRLGDK